MSQNTEEKTWWVFFPLKGLDISDDNHDLLEPIFGDVTLVSKRHVKQIISLLKFYKPNNNDRPTITYLVENIALKEDFHSFVAVRRTGIVNNEEPMPEIVSNARNRAYQFAALLALVFLAKSKSQETCGLVEQLRRHVQNFGHGSQSPFFGKKHLYKFR